MLAKMSSRNRLRLRSGAVPPDMRCMNGAGSEPLAGGVEVSLVRLHCERCSVRR